ncbi:peptidylprolyl isomerase [Rheinheimera sp. NSM]|uniref:peptidylprolyl isomerase n=1 Tax=Rheinheimera sp. NSM TaxID=3457884 RepID=UPI004036612C
MATKLLKMLLAASLLSCSGLAQATIVEVTTNLGKFEINLYDESTPVTVQNFLNYVSAERYNGTVIHRSVPGFIIQGGGFEFDQQLPLKTRPTNPAIINEPKWSNVRATIAMAKQAGNPNSATNQWFINLKNNASNLDFQNSGFTVFGQISSSDMDVIDAIASLPQYDFFAFSSTEKDELPLRNYSDSDYDDNKPLVADNFVVIESVVVVDNRTNTISGLTLVPTTNSGSAGGDESSSGGSFGWFLLPLGLLAFRQRR